MGGGILSGGHGSGQVLRCTAPFVENRDVKFWIHDKKENKKSFHSMKTKAQETPLFLTGI